MAALHVWLPMIWLLVKGRLRLVGCFASVASDDMATCQKHAMAWATTRRLAWIISSAHGVSLKRACKSGMACMLLLLPKRTY